MNVLNIPTSASARAAHADLVASLGTENKPDQWMEFMRMVDRHIPEMTSRGRLSADTIQSSLIGQLGFSSWKAMVEAPIEDNGLNWSSGGWNAWRRAWGLVKRYPFLENEPLKAGWINSLASNVKQLGIDFPINKRELEAIQEDKIKSAETNKGRKMRDAEDRIDELECQVKNLLAENQKLKEQKQNLEIELKIYDGISKTFTKETWTLSEEIATYKNKNQTLSKNLTTQKEKTQTLQSQLNLLKKRNLWERLLNN